MQKLIANVVLGDRWFGPAYPDSEVTPDIARQITNPKAWEGGQVSDDQDDQDDDDRDPSEPRRNASTATWRAYAEGLGLTVPDDAGRDDIVELVDESRQS